VNLRKTSLERITPKGVKIPEFPNHFMTTGPGSQSVLSNMNVSID
tara:strand:- start:272 stop:406 length:135 start_codon:yes stop_codon:yes gene_type:complete